MKTIRPLLFLFVFLLLSLVISLLLGGTRIPISDLLHAIIEPDGAGNIHVILWEIRMPRVILGLLVGAGLGVAGGTLQGMLRNPLAEPYTLGVSGGAALGTTIGSILSGVNFLGGFYLPLCAFMGALVSTACVYLIASRRRFSITTLVLGGIVMNLFISSLILLIFALSQRDRVMGMLLWLMGDLSAVEGGITASVAVLVLGGVAVLFGLSRDLNLLTLGEEKATYLGVNVETIHRIIFILSSFITGACVSASGLIGFVGLIIPHMIRWLTGPDHRVLLPGCFLCGGGFLILCDALARSIVAPVELPVGVVTGVLGGGFFLFNLVKGDRWEAF